MYTIMMEISICYTHIYKQVYNVRKTMLLRTAKFIIVLFCLFDIVRVLF